MPKETGKGISRRMLRPKVRPACKITSPERGSGDTQSKQMIRSQDWPAKCYVGQTDYPDATAELRIATQPDN